MGHCIMCERPDGVDNLVQCDKCDAYVHFTCAGVNEPIANPDRSFVCKRCIETSEFATVSSMRSSKTSRSSRKSAQLALSLQQLEEEKQFRLKKLADEERFQRLRLEEEEMCTKQRYALLQASLIDADDGSSRKSGVSSRVIRENTMNWVKTGGQTEGAKSEVVATSASLPVPSNACNEQSNKLQAMGQQQSGYSPTHPAEKRRVVSASNQVPRSFSAYKLPNFEFSYWKKRPNTVTEVRLTSTPKNKQILPLPSSKPLTPLPTSVTGQLFKSLAETRTSLAPVSSVVPKQPSIPLQGTDKSAPEPFPISVEPCGNLREMYATGSVLPPSRFNLPSGIDSFVPKPPPGFIPHLIDLHSVSKALPLVPPLKPKQTKLHIPQSGSTQSLTEENSDLSTMVSGPPPGPGKQYPLIQNRIKSFNPFAQELGSIQSMRSNTSAIVPPVQPYGPGESRVKNPVCPTAVQIASRQVIPRDLPTFSGDPQDWPLFYSSFRNSTEACGYNDAENLARLQRCLRGHALEAVRCRLLIPESVPYVITTLQKLYGRPEVLINSLLTQLRNVPSPRADDLRTLIKFGLVVQNLVEHMVLAEQKQHLSNPMLLHEMVERLPSNLKMEWAFYKRAFHNVDLATFSEFMAELVNMASDVTLHVDFGLTTGRTDKGRRDKQPKEQLYVHHSDHTDTPREQQDRPEESTNFVIKPCCFCDSSEHRIADCNAFKLLNIDERWKAVRNKGLCRMCLVPHRSWPCRSKRECSFENCRLRHNPLLHSSTGNQNDKNEGTSTCPKSPVFSSDVIHQHHHFVSHQTLLRYLPVTLYNNGKEMEIFAFLDDGSTATMLEADVAEFLDIAGPNEPLYLCWTGDIKRVEEKSQRIQLNISGSGMANQFSLKNVRTVQQLKLPSQTFNYEEHCEVYPHLKRLPLRSYHDVTPKLIIGLDNVKLIGTLKIREGGYDELVAAKTRLGWCSYGRCSGTKTTVEHLNVHTDRCIGNSELHDLVKKFFSIEEACVTTRPEAEEVKKALKTLEETTVRVPTGFEVGLLWKSHEHDMPDSYRMAVRRLKCLEKRLSRDPALGKKVRELIHCYQEKGYAHRASEEELKVTDPRHCWYLPLGVVQNPKKPNKIRLVWDAAARVNNISFNDQLLAGPDLTASLMTVLIRFRQRNIAIGGDIREMFHQIKIRKQDRQFQRFLWRDIPEEPPHVYVMDVATFGATCSPSIAQFIKNRNAEEFAEQFPRAAEAVIENHYVDDFLDSVDTVEEAVELMKQVEYIHAQGGFEIRHFVSNSEEVLRCLGESQNPTNKSLNLDVEESERILGMIWVPFRDMFTFNIAANPELLKLLDRSISPTKRQVLRTVISIFDPLGLIAHVIVHGKILMQDIWRSGVDWDDKIPQHLHERWYAWGEILTRLEEVQIPRCLLGGVRLYDCSCVELHAFVDSSELAYGCAIYLRTVSASGIKCFLVAAKSKVAPLKSVSIPRLELQAALIGSRLMESVCKSLTIPVTQRVFWTDSATVLAWLRSDSRRYHQYVAFRVEEILTRTSVTEWRHVPSKQNVADDVTKWGAGPDLSPESRWCKGPAFLYQDESQWPTQHGQKDTTTEEIRLLLLHREVTVPEPLVDASRFSNWNRLVRAVAYVCRAKMLFHGKDAIGETRGILRKEELIEAENCLWKQVQIEAYSGEKNELQFSRTLDKSSSLYQLSPFLDKQSVIRMGSRIGAAPYISFDAKYPIILPKRHRITYLLIDSYHRRLLHANNETVFNDMRQRFYVPGLRRLIRKVAAECQRCKISKAAPRLPLMAQLPQARLTPFIRPFTYVGVDYFGPLLVKVGRSLVKRWAALFTCLTIRAVHLEVVHSLTTQSCVMSFRRFVARRGAPLEVYSDNGTSYTGANRQLKDEIGKINEDCAATFTNTRTKWIFNPPASPHMGGLWERMVRSVKTAMLALAESVRHPNDETLETVLLEAEGIVNSRPLTYIPLDSGDQEALTPNHFLLYGTQGVTQPAIDSIEYRSTLRDSWKLAKFMADEFWRRWVREYLPVLTKRSKWFEPTKPLQQGDLVLVIDGAKRNQWLRGRILEVFPAADGQVRRARVQTSTGSFLRSAVNLAVLDIEDSRSPKSYGPGNVAATPCSSSLDDVGLETSS